MINTDSVLKSRNITDGETYLVQGLEESISSDWLYYTKQSRD